MALSGNLSEFSVLETLQVIALQQKTGTLWVNSGKQRHGLHFRDGALIGCQPPNPKDYDPFLETLVGLGQVGRDEERRIRMLAAESGTDLWRQIGNSVPLESETLEETRSLVLQGMLDRILLWNKGHFEFDPGPVPPASGPQWNVEQALLESMRRLDEAADLKSGGFPISTVAVAVNRSPEDAPPPDPESSTPPALERAVLSRLDGKRSIAELVKQLAVAEYDVLSCVRDLRNRGLVLVEAGGGRRSTSQMLLEQPRKLRNPALATFLVLCTIAICVVGLQARSYTSGQVIPRHDRAREALSVVREETAVLQSLEVYRLRHGTYPVRLDSLVEEGIWPRDEAARLEGLPYRITDGGHDYLWDGASLRRPSMAEATSSETEKRDRSPGSRTP